MKRDKSRMRGFTLIEITIVAAVVGLLAAIAIPNFLKFQAKSRQSEPKNIMPLIASYEMDYKLRHGKFVECPLNPPKPGGKWNPKLPGWVDLNFEPVGIYDYSYQVVVEDGEFFVLAIGNIDEEEDMDKWQMSGLEYPENVYNDVNRDDKHEPESEYQDVYEPGPDGKLIKRRTRKRVFK